MVLFVGGWLVVWEGGEVGGVRVVAGRSGAAGPDGDAGPILYMYNNWFEVGFG